MDARETHIHSQHTHRILLLRRFSGVRRFAAVSLKNLRRSRRGLSQCCYPHRYVWISHQKTSVHCNEHLCFSPLFFLLPVAACVSSLPVFNAFQFIMKYDRYDRFKFCPLVLVLVLFFPFSFYFLL